MSNKLNDDNLVRLLHIGLKHELGHVLTEQLVKGAVKEYEVKVRASIKPLVEGIVLDKVQKISDIATLTEHLQVYIRWSDDT